jgi:hypothetical protein
MFFKLKTKIQNNLTFCRILECCLVLKIWQNNITEQIGQESLGGLNKGLAQRVIIAFGVVFSKIK